ncbi:MULTISPECIES: IucA/IucC family protein [unclassified Microbulbifer]|uniref:IucA/IucC family protein n=1 Tax=unclassified Microbulbifer TaxID=2619833 RepID=UPI0027E531D0|nr:MULTISPECIES: IucA/IucC family protein [unclassified Microbulbifer]
MTEASQESGELAWRYTGHFLLNCYCREIASPNDLLSYEKEKDLCLLVIDFPYLGQRISVSVRAPSVTGNHFYLGRPCMAGNGVSEPLPWRDLPRLVVGELCRRFSLDGQPELLAQIDNSREILSRILDHHLVRGHRSGDGVDDYLESEAALIFGHSFHPAPKSRYGWNEKELMRYSPELHGSFRLHYFAVAPQYLRLLGDKPDETKQLFRRLASPGREENPDGWPLLPCHPWQANYLLGRSAVREAVASGILKYLGTCGPAFGPTASVRTLFNRNCPYFLKVSLSLRITNSVRKNAWYELESAVVLSKLLRPVIDGLAHRFSGFSLLPEPAAATVDLPQLENEERLDLQSHFGVILRNNPFCDSEVRAQLAGTLFAEDVLGHSNTAPLVRAFRQRHPGMDEATAAIRWFGDYVRQLLPPVLHAFFEHGVAFEPHLQNVLVKLDGCSVAGIILRDMEGTKLDRSRWSDSLWPEKALPSISSRARESMLHERDTAWRRVVYCLFVNNLCQAALHCGRFLESEAPLWKLVRQVLEDYRETEGGALRRELIDPLLAGADLPGKANMITRFTREPDSRAHYIRVANPLGHSAGAVRAAEVEPEVVQL